MKRAPFYMEIPEDEVPYSTVTRYALLGGFRAPIALNQIYNNRKKRIHPYMPGFIEKFADFFDLPPNDVINKRTIFPLVKYAQKSDVDVIKHTMLHQSDDKVILKTAIGHSRFTTFYGLRYCPTCTQDDINHYGFAYWHIRHQIPGVEACFKHRCTLIGIPMGDGNKDRALFLPSFEKQQIHKADEPQVILAQFAAQLFDISLKQDIDYHQAYLHLLRQKELISCNGGFIFMSQIQVLIKEYWCDLPYSDHLGLGVPSVLSDFNFLGRILRKKTHAHAHPLKHILLACWLSDGDVRNLLAYQGRSPAKEKTKTHQGDDIENKVLGLLKLGLSFNIIHEKTGKSRCYIRRVSELNKLPHRTNSQSFSEETRRAVLIKALYGIHRQEISECLGVGIGYVEQVICNEPNMSAWREHLRIQKNVIAASRLLISIRQQHPGWCRTQIRKEAQAAYFILYNHDKVLIEKILPKALKPTCYHKDWAKEDTRLYIAISELVNAKTLSLSEIGRCVNDHSYILTAINKLPKTYALLSKLEKSRNG
jgi:hypothetical protein